MAFVPSVTTTSFSGSRVSNQSFISPVQLSSNVHHASTNKKVNTPTMAYYSAMEALLAKYDAMARAPGAVLPPSQTSSIWKSFVKEMAAKITPSYFEPSFFTDFEIYMYGITSRARPFVAPGGSPKESKADEYMSKCIKQQYKSTACATGVYNVSCTEGAVKLQADQSRIMALGKEFKLKQRSSIQKFGSMFENRKKAVMLAHECSYEEALYLKLPTSSMVANQAYAESIGACSRSAVTEDPAEQYMMNCVDRACKQLTTVPSGVYSTACSDGTVKEMAEEKRVIGLAAKFRAGQLSKIAKAQRDYDRKKNARDMYAHGCDYEETLFNKYPAMAASMSGMGSPY